MKKYLDIYDKQILYQRAGYILNQFKADMELSDKFINYCKRKIGSSKRYLINDMKENNILDKEWKLMIPNNTSEIGDQGGSLLV